MKIFTFIFAVCVAQMSFGQDKTSDFKPETPIGNSATTSLTSPEKTTFGTKAISILEKKNRFDFSDFEQPDFQPNIEWLKKSTLYFIDNAYGGYSSYVIHDNWMTLGKHYNSYFEIAPNCFNAYQKQQPANAGNVASLLAYGLLRDVFDIPSSYKIGKRTSFVLFE
ncbi:MAG: hypothetical protein EOO50_11725 [Flavobacterium sp.]|uniref:hypothetical protein n=1 Tax=Flavobacterium sp. TaxID=239 RepID=UPI0012253D02|nr:hypothetical protein [Flavobacterium sp.]RZJ65929.1 MAG: hypothetical protein EOO50_11725 [Flavobacterium sp.]